MESRSAQARHEKQVFIVACTVGLMVLVGYSIRNYLHGDVLATWIHVLMVLVVGGGTAGLLLGREDGKCYRVVLSGVGIGLLCLAAVAPNFLYFHLLMPLLYFFFLGKRDGGMLTGFFFLGVVVLLLAPGLAGTQVYGTEQGIRFLVGYVFVSIIAWGHESSSQRLYAHLLANNQQLEDERKQLERALEQITETEARLEQTVSELHDRGQLMKTVFDNMDEGVVVADADGKLLLFNPGAERILGIGLMDATPEEWSDTYGAFYLDEETRVPTEQLPLVRALQGENTDNLEYFVRNKEKPGGTYVSARGRFIPGDDDASVRVKAGVVVFSDITKHKEQEAKLMETISELKRQALLMETVFRSVSDGVVVTGKDGEFLFVNPSAQDIVGMGATDSPSDEWAAKYGTFYPDKVTPFPSEELPLVRAMHGEVTDDVEVFIRNEKRPGGVSISVNGRPLQDESGLIEGGVVVLRDVTSLKATESELRQTVRELQDQTHLMETVFNSISDGVIVVDEAGDYLIFSPGARNILGMQEPDADFSRRSQIYGLYNPDSETLYPTEKLPLTRAVRGESSDDVELLVRNSERPDGVYVSVNGRPLRDDTNRIRGGVITLRDVTRLKTAESELQKTAENLRTQTHAMETIFKSISDGVVVADEEGNFTIFNPSAERMVGVGKTDSGPTEWADRYGIFFPDRETPYPMDELPLVRAIQGEASDEVEMFIRNPSVPDGVYISVSGRPLQDHSGITKGGVIVFRDVTERMLAEEALSQAFAQGRLEIVDTILHNIGNAINSVAAGLGTIQGELTENQLVRRMTALAAAIGEHRDDWISYLKTDPQGQKVLPFILGLARDFAAQNAQLTRTVDRVDSRVTHIVDIIRTQRSIDTGALARKDIDLLKAISDATTLLQDSLGKRGVQVDVDCRNAPEEIRIQESKFHQMMVNLVKNAIEAIDELRKTGGLEVKPHIRIRSYVQNEYLVIDVIDNGIGIEEKHLKIIFAAGYTTKEVGSGLGLHSIANFIIGSGGQIYPISAGNGKGTTMRVKLRLSSVVPKSEAEEVDSVS